jgi:hypothetical protein
MKSHLAVVALLAGGLLVTTHSRADCTWDPAAMGRDAAVMACLDIVNGWVPRAFASSSLETSCSTNDVIDCKNAMALYLRRENQACRDLINRNVPLVDSRGNFMGTAFSTWASYVTRTCNLM